MNYKLIKDVVALIEDFEDQLRKEKKYANNIDGFMHWLAENTLENAAATEPDWEGKEAGRSPESVINTLIQHVNRYAKTYSKSAIHNSDFSTQEEFIYLINLKAFGAMTKMDLIKRNIHDKPAGIQIINRLINQGWVEQHDSKTDKRSKVISLTQKGLQALEQQMAKVRQAAKIVTGSLNQSEKMQLIRLLQKLADFHQPIYNKSIAAADLIDRVLESYLPDKPSLTENDDVRKQ